MSPGPHWPARRVMGQMARPGVLTEVLQRAFGNGVSRKLESVGL